MLRRVRDRVLARLERPLAPRRDDRQLRRERPVGELEAHLVVALARAAVGERVAAGLAGDLDLDAGDQRPGERRPEEVAPLVDRAGAQRGEDVVGDEGVLHVDGAALDRAGCDRLLRDRGEVFDLADVGDDRDDLAAVGLPQPRDDDGGIETSGVSERDFADFHGSSFEESVAATVSGTDAEVENFVEDPEGAVHILGRHDQGRREPQRVRPHRVDEKSVREARLDDRRRLAVEIRRHEESGRANRAEHRMGRAKPLEPGGEPRAHRARVLDQVLGFDRVEDRADGGGSERVAAEGRAVVAGNEVRRGLLGREHDARGNAAGEPLASVTTSGRTPLCSQANIRPVRPMPVCTSSRTRRSPWASQIARSPAQVLGGGHDDAALALNRLDENRGGRVRHGGLHRVEVVEGDEEEPGRERLEPDSIARVAGRGQGSERAAVERVVGDEDLVALRTLDGLARFRASLIAASLASVPLLQKNARSRPERSTSRRAASTCSGIWYRFETWM